MWQQLERAGGRADFAGRDAQVPGRCRQAAMTEQQLNGPHISAGFEEMDGKRVAKGMWRDWFGETGQTKGFLAGLLYGALRDRPIVANTGKQPLLRANGSPVAAQDLQQLGREHDISILAALAMLDTNNHPGAVDGGAFRRTTSEMRKPAA
jgi:hypothetical protein